ncbi:hypothetical protein RFM99_20005 [Mesorhizobium sp. VK4C]|uniref:hypothetical protein n=1 Tax=Mesorhizobium captivum TaxID=3072319 RepID=UPI002A244096|nr:hypothetical protein [Mesorhizobium sp. VK4C]MDX8500691.1 hypothetical protein [Mesorhizobium sp. VK4C]
MNNSITDILAVEDIEQKFEDIERVLGDVFPQARISRAKTVVEATDQLRDGEWQLLILDISMDIAPSASGPARGGHANLGGMDVVEEMFLTEREVPTVIVTGFDYFITTRSDLSSDAQTFSDIEAQAARWLGGSLLGCIRYGISGWEPKLRDALEKLA